MKIKVWVSIVRAGHDTGEYPGGVRTTLSFTRKEALCDIVDFLEMHADDKDELLDQDTATEEDLEGRIEQAHDEGEFDSWGVDDFELELPGVPEILVKALQEASRALTQLDSLANKHDAVLIDDALTYCREAGQASTPPEQIAAILKANCPQGDELQADGILRAAMTQFVRESDAEVKGQ